MDTGVIITARKARTQALCSGAFHADAELEVSSKYVDDATESFQLTLERRV